MAIFVAWVCRNQVFDRIPVPCVERGLEAVKPRACEVGPDEFAIESRDVGEGRLWTRRPLKFREARESSVKVFGVVGVAPPRSALVVDFVHLEKRVLESASITGAHKR